MRRFHKKLSGEQYRWKRVESCASSKRHGFATTDSKEFGALVTNVGPHAEARDPSQSATGAEAVRREITGAGPTGLQKPNHVVADALGGVSSELPSALPNRESLRRSAQNAKKRQRERGYQQGEGGVVPNSRTLEELVSPQELVYRPNGEDFTLHDSGAGPERIVMFGTQGGVGCLRGAEIWSADGAFKVAPLLWAQMYTVHAVMGGYVPPCIFALPPNKTGGELRKNVAADQGASR